MRLLLVEDDTQLGATLKRALQHEGYVCDWAQCLRDADDFLGVSQYDLILLDWMLPDGNGPDTLKKYRQAGLAIPIIMLTARTSVEDRIIGLDCGADDYLCKSFDLEELMARVRALLRRRHVNPSNKLEVGNFVLDGKALSLRVNDKEFSVSPIEAALLDKLFRNAGRYVSKVELENAAYDWDREITPNAIEAHISRLRKRLGSDSIKTMRGVGYKVICP